MLGLPSLESMDTLFFLRASERSGMHATVLRVFTERRYRHHRAENLFQSVHVKLLSCGDKVISSLLRSVDIFAFTPAGYGRGLAADCCLATSACADKKRTARDATCRGEKSET